MSKFCDYIVKQQMFTQETLISLEASRNKPTLKVEPVKL